MQTQYITVFKNILCIEYVTFTIPVSTVFARYNISMHNVLLQLQDWNAVFFIKLPVLRVMLLINYRNLALLSSI